VRRGDGWERPAGGPADLEVEGDDRTLASWVASAPGARIRFRPTRSDVALAVGVTGEETRGMELPMDVLALADGDLATNMVVLGTPPDRLHRFTPRVELSVTVDGRTRFEGRATTVVVATGQFLRGLDVVPRGHPGDGRAEVQAYRLRPAERHAMRSRLARGEHVPHPRIVTAAGREIAVRAGAAMALEVDGGARPKATLLEVRLVPEAYSLLV
jgi:hypothetical protein